VSRVDENGTVHPTDNDPYNAQTATHLAFCRECNPYALPTPLLCYQRHELAPGISQDIPHEHKEVNGL
jgi:hypothetical protein